MDQFAEAVAEAAKHSPMANQIGGDPVPGRTLLVDGDGLCYYCAGNDNTSPGQARQHLIDKVNAAANACRAQYVKVLVTSRGSHKGHRYAVARVKPYQGQRASSRRPKNWEALREYLEAGVSPYFEVVSTCTAEADDLFALHAANPGDSVIYTQDKDMRMVPGWHLDWLTHILVELHPGTFRVEHHGKLYGRAWFWTQMLMGDTADNIPGLPKYAPDPGVPEVLRPVGAVTAGKLLSSVHTDMEALFAVQQHYRTFYGERWLVEMLEQGALLWMRNDPGSDVLNVAAPGSPMEYVRACREWPTAAAEIRSRINEATKYAETQDA